MSEWEAQQQQQGQGGGPSETPGQTPHAYSPPTHASAHPGSNTAGIATAAGSATVTITETATQDAPETLLLSLQARPNVRWEEGVVDNEGLGRKSSKRCCIFHKQRAFGESSTDSSDEHSDGSSSSSASGSHQGDPKKKKSKPKGKGKIASAKNGKVPDSQRFHA